MNQQSSQAPQEHNLNDQTLAASLGFITTLGQHAHAIEHAKPPEGQQQPQNQAPAEPQSQDNKPQDHEAEQDQEIQSIRAELEQLLAEEQKPEQQNGTPTEDTTTTR